MTEHRSIRYGVLGVVALLALGLVWLGVVRYRAEQRVRAAATAAVEPAPAAVAGPAPAAVPAALAQPLAEPQPQLVVHVAGAVVNPGVYRLDRGARVIDALTAAGGPLKEAAMDALNLAQPLEDGQQVLVQTKQEAAAQPVVPAPAPSASASKAAPSKVNVNTAAAAQLDQLPGISPKVAQAIVDYRAKHGPFKRLEDLDKVTGIGPSTLSKIQSHITF